MLQPKIKLRKTVTGRKWLNFMKADVAINKELDLSNILLSLRRTKYFMRMFLDTG